MKAPSRTVEKSRQRRSRPVVAFGLTTLALFAPFALTYSVVRSARQRTCGLAGRAFFSVLACNGWFEGCLENERVR